MSLSSQSSAGIKDPSSDPPSVSSNNEGIDVKVQPENKSGGNNKSAEADRKKDEELKRISLTKMQWLSKVTMLKSQSGWKAYVFKMKMVFADLLVLDAFLVKVGEDTGHLDRAFDLLTHNGLIVKVPTCKKLREHRLELIARLPKSPSQRIDNLLRPLIQKVPVVSDIRNKVAIQL